MQPYKLVSVIIPAYNASATIAKTLNSVLNQTYKNLEIIVVDDGSKDQTPEIIRSISSHESRIRVITQKNMGVSAARNTALLSCAGDYIRFVDADDVLPAESIERMVHRAMDDQGELVIGGYTECVNHFSRVKNLENSNETVDFQHLLPSLARHANSYYYGVLWNKLFSGDLIRKYSLRFDDSLWWGEDFAFVMTYLKYVQHIAMMQVSVYEYRRSPASTTFRQVLDCFIHPLENIRIKRKLYGYLKSLYKERLVYDSYKRVLWHYLFRIGLI